MIEMQITDNLWVYSDERQYQLFDPRKNTTSIKNGTESIRRDYIGYFPSLDGAVQRAFNYEVMTSDAKGMLAYREVCEATLKSILKNLGVLPNISVTVDNE